MQAGSHLYIGRGALLRDKSRDFAHGGCYSLEQIQPVDWIIRGRNDFFEGDDPCNGRPLLTFISARAAGLYSMGEQMLVFSSRKKWKDAVKSA